MDRSGHVAEALRRLQGGPGGPSSALPTPAPGLHSAGSFTPGSGPSAAPPSPGWLGDVVSFVPLGLTRGWEQPLGHKPRFCTYRPPAPATPGSSLAEERPAAWMAPWRGLPAGLTRVRDQGTVPQQDLFTWGMAVPKVHPHRGLFPEGHPHTHRGAVPQGAPTGGLSPKGHPHTHRGGCSPEGHPHTHRWLSSEGHPHTHGGLSLEGHPRAHGRQSPKL